MNKEIAKTIVGTIVGMSASQCAGYAIQDSIPMETKVQKTIAFIGKFGIGMAVGAAVRTQTDKMVDDIAEAIDVNYTQTR